MALVCNSSSVGTQTADTRSSTHISRKRSASEAGGHWLDWQHREWVVPAGVPSASRNVDERSIQV